MHYDIEESIDIDPFSIDIDSLRHRRNVDIDPFFTDIDPSRYRRNFDISVRCRSFFASISNVFFLDICAFCLGCCSPCSVLETYCRVNYSLRIKRLACGLRLWNRLTRTSRSQESPSSRLEMIWRSGPLKPRRTLPPSPRLSISPPRGESVA